MQNIRTFFMIVTGFAIIATMALLTASLAVAALGILAAASLGRALSARRKPVPIRVRHDDRRDMRVWNDGRGKIIDL